MEIYNYEHWFTVGFEKIYVIFDWIRNANLDHRNSTGPCLMKEGICLGPLNLK